MPGEPAILNETVANGTVANGFADATGVAPVLFVIAYVAVFIGVFRAVAPWMAKAQVLSRVWGVFLTAIRYAMKGLVASVVVGVTMLPIYAVATTDAETQTAIGVVIVGACGAFVVLVGVGVLADRAISVFIDAHPEYDEWADIWDGHTSDQEAVADGGSRE